MRRWSLVLAGLLFSRSVLAKPTWSVVKEGIPVVGSPGYLHLYNNFSEEENRLSSLFHDGYHWVAWRRENWPTWLRIGENGALMDIPSKGILTEAERNPLLGVLGGKVRLFYRDQDGAKMATLDSSSGEALEISPTSGTAVSVVKGKDKVLVLWTKDNQEELWGSFFDENTLQWGNLFSLGKNGSIPSFRNAVAAFDGKRFLVARIKAYPYALEVLWLDPLQEGWIEESKEITKNGVINLALACVGPEDCICTFSEPPQPSSKFLKVVHLGSPGQVTLPESIYPNQSSFVYNAPLSDLFAEKDGYIFSTTRVDSYPPGDVYRIDRLGQDGKYKETIFSNDMDCNSFSLSVGPESVFYFCGLEKLYGQQVDRNLKNQEAVLDHKLDLDFPSTFAHSAKFWQNDFWVSFSLTRTELKTGKQIVESWVNRINQQGELVASHPVPGYILATGNTRALLASDKTLFLMAPDGSYEKVSDIFSGNYEGYRFDGVRFVGLYDWQSTYLLHYIEEDGTQETRNFSPESQISGSYSFSHPTSCQAGSCIFFSKSFKGTNFLEVPFQKNPFFWPGYLNDIDPLLNECSGIQSDGESIFSLHRVGSDSLWFLRLNKEDIAFSEVIGKIPFDTSITGEFFPHKNQFILGTKEGIFHFDGKDFTTIDYPNHVENTFSPSQENKFLIQFYSLPRSPTFPSYKSFSTIWHLQEDVPGGGPPSGGEGGANPGGTGNAGGSPSSQGGTGGQTGQGGVPIGSPSGTRESTAGKPPEEGPPRTQAFPSEEQGGCGCRWGTTELSSPSVASLLVAFASAQRRRRKTLR